MPENFFTQEIWKEGRRRIKKTTLSRSIRASLEVGRRENRFPTSEIFVKLRPEASPASFFSPRAMSLYSFLSLLVDLNINLFLLKFSDFHSPHPTQSLKLNAGVIISNSSVLSFLFANFLFRIFSPILQASIARFLANLEKCNLQLF